ncbi:MAG TPA: methylated-DNA--[protein]-cysteine S-methyltransferase [Haloplasmataceae bacterium]
MLSYSSYHSPIGDIYVVVSDKGVFKIELFADKWKEFLELNPNLKDNKTLCDEVIKQIDEYFHNKRMVFNLPLDIKGTSFQKKVWEVLLTIPYGKTLTYKEVAEKCGNVKAVRAIGQANKANNLPILIPCHRVIGKNGKLVGYAGDKVEYKEWLLKHESLILEGGNQ